MQNLMHYHTNKLESRFLKKGEIVQRPNELNTRIYQVRSGLLRSYSIDNKGRQHIFMFAPEGWTIADTNPANQTSDLFIDAIEDSEVLVFPKNIDREKDNVAPILKRLSVLQKRVIMLMSASAIDRYEHFVNTYPDILQRVPQKMIASYLGITPEALSKVKGQRIRTRRES